MFRFQVLFGVAPLLVCGCSQTPDAIHPAPVVPPAQVVRGAGVAITLPKGWQAIDLKKPGQAALLSRLSVGPATRILAIGPDLDGYTANLQMTVKPATSQSEEEAMWVRVNHLKKSGATVDIEKVQTLTLPMGQVPTYQAQFHSRGCKLLEVGAVKHHGSEAYYFTFRGSVQAQYDLLKVAQTTMNSARF